MSNFSVFHNEPQEMTKHRVRKGKKVFHLKSAKKNKQTKKTHNDTFYHEATTSNRSTFNSNRLKMSMHNCINSNMDRENEEENIYANEESNSHDIRTGRQISTTHQTSGSSGDSVRIRNYRAATVCSVQLCVVLLTALIVLGVHIITKSTNYTQETQQLQTKIINLTEEKTQQVSEIINLTQEKTQQVSEIINLTQEKTQQLSEIINLTEEKRQLQSDNTNLINERGALLSKNNDLIRERNACRQDFFKENNGWIYGHSSFYYISSEKKSWNESRSYCTERGADLIIINNKEEHDFVQKIIDRHSLFWIGLTDIDEEGSWKWVDGSTPTFWYWGANEPNGKREENCALVHSSFWADYPCDDAYFWICEKNILI
ncbi:hypothetical protein ABG768_021740 [Culter alburnus]|uniref:C-type lectin domain-containing protein n=1 Tax=Culter alburnus TaxID=194366 RepID=A0AAW2AS05_CULAL